MIDAASQAWFRRAERILPGGVNSPVRAFRAVGGTPRYIRRASGAFLYDEDGHELVDLIGSWGAMIAGHAHPAVSEAIARAAGDGTSFGACSRLEVELAEEVQRRFPSLEQLRFVNSGTEAVMSAIRLARAATGRNLILKFDGGYHGHLDALLTAAGSGPATLGIPSSPGVPSEVARDTLSVPYNDLDAVSSVFSRHDSRVAAVVVEPVAGNMGVVLPREGFLEGLRRLTSHHGALLIFDEVMSGFRVAPGGAQERYGVRPDLTTLGKVLGGGLPVGAFGGRRDLMQRIAPAGDVYQAGTMSGNPVVMAAGLATLRILTAESWARLASATSRLEIGLRAALARAGIVAAVPRAGAMLSVFFGVEWVDDFAAAQRADHRRFAAFFRGMLSEGVHLPPSGYEAWFLSLAHDEAVIDRTLRAVDRALAKAAPDEP